MSDCRTPMARFIYDPKYLRTKDQPVYKTPCYKPTCATCRFYQKHLFTRELCPELYEDEDAAESSNTGKDRATQGHNLTDAPREIPKKSENHLQNTSNHIGSSPVVAVKFTKPISEFPNLVADQDDDDDDDDDDVEVAELETSKEEYDEEPKAKKVKITTA